MTASPATPPTTVDQDRNLLDAQSEVSRTAVPGLKGCLDLAKVYEKREEYQRAVQWAFAAADAGDDFAGWLDGVRSVLVGAAANQSLTTGQVVHLADFGIPLRPEAAAAPAGSTR